MNTYVYLCVFVSLLSASVTSSDSDPYWSSEWTTKKPKECPEEPNGVLITLPHETECSKFYVCIDKEKVEQDCPEGLHYDPKTGSCDWPSVVHCALTTTKSPWTTSSKPETTETPTTTSKWPETTWPPWTTSKRPETTKPPTTTTKYPETTQPPTTTSKWPETTKPPTTTTKYPETTQPPTTTTKWPETTKPPTTTSKYPETTKPPTTTTKWPETTKPPTTTTKYPETTKPPTTTTKWPETTKPPTTTTKQPETTKPPTTTTKHPETTKPPTTTTKHPETTKPPTTTTKHPETTKPPTTTTKHPETTKPPTTTTKWPETTKPPTTTTKYPETTKPPTTTTKYPETTKPPTTTTKKPSYPTSCPIEDPPIPIFLPHECVCSKFYVCGNGLQILEECPDGLHFNSDIHDCDLPENAGCVPPVTTPKPPTILPPDGCPAEVSEEAVHIPHETNCSLYYTCTYGGKVLQKCPTGLYFNPELQVCDWPWNVNCTNKEPSTTTLKPTTKKLYKREAVDDEEFNPASTSKPTIPTTTPKWQNPESCIGKCPSVDPLNYTIHLPNTRCDKFCACSNGRAIVISCPAHLHYSVKLQVCTYPHEAKCTDLEFESFTKNVVRKEENNVIDNKEALHYERFDDAVSTSKPDIPTTTPKWQNPDSCIGKCPSVDPLNYTIHLPNTRCDKFCACSNGRAIVISCPAYLHYSVKLQVCTYPHEAKCTDLEFESFTKNVVRKEENNVIDNKEALHYERFDDAVSTSKPDIPTTTPKWQNPDSCIGKCPSVDPLNYTIHLPNTRCDKFCACSNGRAIVISCPASLHYSVKLEVCTYPHEAKCTGIGEITTTSKPSSTEASTTSKSTTTDGWRSLIQKNGNYDIYNDNDGEAVQDEELNPVSTSKPTIPTTTPKWQNPDSCIGKCPSVDPLNYTIQLQNIRCDKFCKCSNGRAFVIPCPANLHYSVKLEVCTYPHEAKCTGIGGITTTSKPSSTEASTTSKSTTTDGWRSLIQKKENYDIYNDNDGEAVQDEELNPVSTSKPTIPTTTPKWQNPDSCIGKCPHVDPLNYTVQLPNIRCDKFCKCSNGRAFVIPCPANLHYSVKLEVCTYPYEAKCTGIGEITTTSKPSSTEASTTSKSTTTDGWREKDEVPASFFNRIFNLW